MPEQLILDCVVIGAGLVGSATASHLASLCGPGGVALVGPATADAPSSHDDCSRVVTSRTEDSARSVRAYSSVEAESGVAFFHPSGYLVVGAAAAGDGSGQAYSSFAAGDRGEGRQQDVHRFDGVDSLTSRWPYLGKGIADVAEGGQTSLVSVLQPGPHAGWIDPRKHVLAHIELARRRGVEVVQELAVSITRSVCQEGGGGGGGPGEWLVQSESGRLLRTRKVAVAVGAWTLTGGGGSLGLPSPLSPSSLSRLLCGVVSGQEAVLWGKSVYHARLSSSSDAEALSGMPTVLVKYSKDAAPAGSVSYSGAKAGFYVYFFPPVVYEDGHSYIKIGHSPFDPLIASLGDGRAGSADGEEEGKEEEGCKLQRWMSSEGEDVRSLQGKSRGFFRDTLRQLFPDVQFDDAASYCSHCVTTKTASGNVFIGAVAIEDGGGSGGGGGGGAEYENTVFACVGCNGAGAAQAHAWGEQLATAVAGK